MKKLLSLILALTLIAGVMLPLTAMADSETFDEVYVIDGFGGDEETYSNKSKIGKLVEEKFGIVFHNIPFAGDMTEKMSLWLVGGDYPAWMQIDTAELVNAYIQADALLSYDDYADIMPDFFEVFSMSAEDARKVAPDGKLYYFTGATHLVPDPYVPRDTYCMFIVRSDLLEEQGWPNLLTGSEWVDFFKKAKENHPKTDDGLETYVNLPLGEAWGYNTLFDIGIDSFRASHTTGYSRLDEVPTIYDGWDNAAQRSTMSFWNELWRNNLLDPESFTDKSDQMVAKAATTQSLAGWYARWMYGGANSQLLETGNEKYMYVEMPFRNDACADEGIRINSAPIGNYSMAPGFGCKVVTKNCKYPERLMSFINWLCTQEGRLINDWGFEGEQYYYDEDGNRRVTEEALEMYKNDQEAWNSIGLSFCNWGLTGAQLPHPFDNQPGSIHYSDEIQALVWYDREIEAIQKTTGAMHPWDVFKGEGSRMYQNGVEYVQYDESWTSAMTLPSDDDDLIMINQEIIDYTTSMIPKIIMAETEDEFNALYDECLAGRMDRGLQTIIDFQQAAVDAYLAEKAAA